MKLYKAKELAEILQVNVQTVYRRGRDGRIKTVRVGRSVRFAMPEIDAMEDLVGANIQAKTDQ